MNNKLAEWRAILDKCVENYQSTRAWYEENRDSPAALDDMERARDQLTKFVRKYGVHIVLNLLDEIDELQKCRKTELVGNEFIPKNMDKALAVVGVALPESKEEFNFQIERWIQILINRVIRYADEFKEQPVPVVPEE